MPKVLYIDDDTDLLEVSKSLLIRKGFEVEVESNWREGLRKIQSFNPQIILLDVFLSEIDGLEICKKIKSDPVSANIPILIVSGYPKVSETVYDSGAVAFLAKPFDINELVSHIHLLLNKDHIMA